MTNLEEKYHPYVHVVFKGDWSDAEQDAIRQALSAAEAYMPGGQRRRLKGSWLASANRADGDRYLAVHRLGIGAAFTAGNVETLTRQIRARWPEPDRKLVG